MEQHEPLVSVIIPVYNAGREIKETLDSICAQTYQNLEILLIDDGSTDESGAICDKYAAADSRFRVFHLQNGGAAKARNFGLDHMTGEYVTFVDSDDLVKPECVQLLQQAAEETNADIAVCMHMSGKTHTPAEFEAYTVSREKPEKVIALADYIATDPIYYHVTVWGAIYHASLAEGLRFSPDLYVGEDTLFFFQMFKRAGSLTFLEDQLYYYRYRDDSLAHSRYSSKQATEVTSWERVIALFKGMPKPLLNELRAATGVRCKKNLINAARAGFEDRQVKRTLYRKTWSYCGSVLTSRGLSFHNKIQYIKFLLSTAIKRK